MEYNMELVDGLRKLTAQEFSDLEESCLDSGILDPIKTWNGYLIDGRHRLKIAKKHGLEYSTEELEIKDLEAARAWVLLYQSGRRNHTEIEQQRTRAAWAKLTSVEAAAEQHGVSPRTIHRDIEADRNMTLMSEDVRDKCLSGEIINSRADWKRYAGLTPEERKAVDAKLRDDPGLSMRDALPEHTHNLTQHEHEVIGGCEAFSPKTKRAFAMGEMQADSASIKKLAKLPEDKLELLSAILEDPEVGSLKKAFDVMSEAKPNKENQIQRIKREASRLLDRVCDKLDDLMALGVAGTQETKESIESSKQQLEAL